MSVKTDTSLQVRRLIRADAETVFRAWTDPQELRQWSCPEGSTVEDAEVDLRVGGRYRIRMKGSEGERHTAVGVYRAIEPARRLVYSWDWEEDDHEIGESLVTVEFKKHGHATEVILTHERFPSGEATKAHEKGWTSCLDRLERRFDGERGKPMRSTILVVGLLVAAHASAQDWQAKPGSIDDYVMDEALEVALARSAAPDHVSEGARILVLRKDGYHEVAAGANGFTCLVERSWSSPIGPHRDFFNRELRAPICYNGEASRTVLGDYLRRTELVLGGSSIGEIREAIERDIATGRLRAPRGFAMSYMLSGGQHLGSEVGRFKPHLMIYVPYVTPEQLGSPPSGCEHICIFEHAGGPLAALILPMKEFNEVSIPSPRHEGDSHP